jgi:type II secretory pathway component GspD/PulD (secretin)
MPCWYSKKATAFLLCLFLNRVMSPVSPLAVKRRRSLRALSLIVCAAIPLSATGPATSAQDPPKRVSVEAANEPIQTVLLRLAHASHASIAVSSSVSGYVTVSLHDVTLANALDAILTPLGDGYHVHGNVYQVDPLPPSSLKAPLGSGASTPAVLPLAVVSAKRAAAQLRALFPQAAIRADEHANALVVIAPAADVQSMRTVLQGLDVRDPMAPVTEAITLRTLKVADVIARLQASFPHATFAPVGRSRLLVTATRQDLAQVRTAVSVLDTPDAIPMQLPSSMEAVRVDQRPPGEVARTIEAQVPGVRAAVSGSTVVLNGTPELVQRAKMLIAQIDVPTFGTRYTQVYRLRNLDAGSVAELLRRSFAGIDVSVDTSINAIAVSGTAAQQRRINDAVSQVDGPSGGAGGLPGTASFGGATTEVITLKSYVPNSSSSGGGGDIVQTIGQALQTIAPDVKVIALPTPGQIALVGSTSSLLAAHAFIDKIDVVPPLVVLDTEVLEIDESVTENLGLQLGTTSIGTTYTETTPAPNAEGVYPKLGKLQALTRTPISFQATLNLALSNGKGRVLADPRITTLSGHTASIRAGDTISILTTTAGNAGTIATTQVQSFQTGVNLDITPSVTPDGGVTVFLHPVVNSLAGTNNGVPEISTRDTQTTVHLQDNQTLVIGGLIQENNTRTINKIPILGDLPLIGQLFTNNNVDNERNELVIIVTPHIVRGPDDTISAGRAFHETPVPQALPTLPPGASLPSPSDQQPPVVATYVQTTPVAGPSPSPLQSPRPGVSPSPSVAPGTFSYGSIPASNIVRSTDPVKIFAATFTPTTVTNGTSIHVTAVTSNNAVSAKIVIGTVSISLGQTGSGQWQGTFPFPGSDVPPGQQSVTLLLVVSRIDGTAASLPIPVTALTP